MDIDRRVGMAGVDFVWTVLGGTVDVEGARMASLDGVREAEGRREVAVGVAPLRVLYAGSSGRAESGGIADREIPIEVCAIADPSPTDRRERYTVMKLVSNVFGEPLIEGHVNGKSSLQASPLWCSDCRGGSEPLITDNWFRFQ